MTITNTTGQAAVQKVQTLKMQVNLPTSHLISGLEKGMQDSIDIARHAILACPKAATDALST